MRDECKKKDEMQDKGVVGHNARAFQLMMDALATFCSCLEKGEKLRIDRILNSTVRVVLVAGDFFRSMNILACDYELKFIDWKQSKVNIMHDLVNTKRKFKGSRTAGTSWIIPYTRNKT